MSSKKGEKKGDRKIKKKTLTPQDEALQHILEFISTTLYPLFSNEHAMKMVPRDEDKDKREQMELAIQAASATFIRSVSLFTVGFRGPPEDPEACVPGAKMVESSLAKLTEVVLSAMALVATPLRLQLADVMTGTLTALVNLVNWFVNQKHERRNVATIYGVVVEYSEKLSKFKLDDKTAVSNAITIWEPAIIDAVKELEAVKEEEVSECKKKDSEDNDDDDFDDDDFDDETLSAEELVVRPSVVTLAKLSVMVLKKTSASILSSPKEMSITQMEEFIQMAKEVSFHVDEMMCSVYRPQDRATVYRNANTLATLLLNLARKTLDHLPPNDSSNNCKVLGLIITKIEDTISKFPQTN